MRNCWIEVGANIGDARAAFDGACRLLSNHPEIQLRKRSGIYQTRPVGSAAGATFTNAAVSVATSLTPLDLLGVLQEVETALGRTRDVRWGPRVIDLDLLFFEQIELNHPRLTLPHPAAWYRRFVLDPLVEIEAALLHPLLGESVGDLKRHLQRRPLVIAVDKCGDALVPQLQSEPAFNSSELRIERCRDCLDTAIVAVRLDAQEAQEAQGPRWNGVPVADLTGAPGDPLQRVIDFCTAVLDEPIRVSDW